MREVKIAGTGWPLVVAALLGACSVASASASDELLDPYAETVSEVLDPYAATPLALAPRSGSATTSEILDPYAAPPPVASRRGATKRGPR